MYNFNVFSSLISVIKASRYFFHIFESKKTGQRRLHIESFLLLLFEGST